MVSAQRAPWDGEHRTLIISIDVGTTFTAASFCILQPGSIPKFEEILRWPKQTISSGKVPSAVMYDQWGRATAYAAEAEDDETMLEAEEQEWKNCTWWKLHLRPAHLPLIANLELPSLPPYVTSVDVVLADFLGYIQKCVRDFIITSHGGGDQIWAALYPSMHVILTTPNGWEGAQQKRMRTAAYTARLVDGNGGQRVHFVTEAEAAFLYAVDSGCVDDWVKTDAQLIMCDCGGGTIDITYGSYRVTSVNPLKIEESTAAACHLAGSIFVTKACRTWLENHFKGSEWSDAEIIERAVSHFDDSGKRKFDGNSTVFVDVGGHRSSVDLAITRGRLKIPREVAATFFAHSLITIKNGIQKTSQATGDLAKHMILVGGLASSPYMLQELTSWGTAMGLIFSRPDGPMTKAVANGALAWYVDNPMLSRISKFHYGAEVNIPFDPTIPEMKHRIAFRNKQGEMRVENAWSGIVAKNTAVQVGQEFFQPYKVSWSDSQISFKHTTELYTYRETDVPRFLSPPNELDLYPGLQLLCSVQVDLENAFNAAPTVIGNDGRKYRDVPYEVCIAFGETELMARLRWRSSDYEWKYGEAILSHFS